jgi:hypothetical protein
MWPRSPRKNRPNTWRVGGLTFVKALEWWGGPGVEPRGLHIILINQTKPTANKWVPRGSPSLGHVAPFHSPKICHVSHITHCQPITYCHVTCHVTVRSPRQHCTASATSATVRTVRTGTVSIQFFLPVWLGEQIAISSPYGLRLRK